MGIFAFKLVCINDTSPFEFQVLDDVNRGNLDEIHTFLKERMDYLYGRTDIRRKVHYDEIGGEYIDADCVRESRSPYGIEPKHYLDDETAKIAQEIKENDNILFDAYKSTSRDRLIAYAENLWNWRRWRMGMIDCITRGILSM